MRQRPAEHRSLGGVYRGAAYSHTNYEKLKAMFYQVRVREVGDGTLLVAPPGGGAPLRLRPQASLVFAGDSGEVIAFRGGDRLYAERVDLGTRNRSTESASSRTGGSTWRRSPPLCLPYSFGPSQRPSVP